MTRYKTISLELLQQHVHPVTTLLLGHYSAALQASHERWLSLLARQRPDGEPSQLSSEALELALKDLEEQLQTDFPQESETNSPLSLDDAMAYLRRKTPPKT